MLDDILKEIREQVGERLASPLVFSFAISWCAWNYKFLVILLSDASVLKTFALIDTVAFPDWKAWVTRGAIFPAVTAAIYLFLLPYPEKIVFEFRRKRQKEINECRQRVEEETLLTLEESRRLRAELTKLEAEHKEAVDLLASELARLKDALKHEQLNKQAGARKASDESKPGFTAATPIQSEQLLLLNLIGGSRKPVAEEWLIGAATIPPLEAEFHLGELFSRGLVSKDFSSKVGSYLYTLTHEGRRILVTEKPA